MIAGGAAKQSHTMRLGQQHFQITGPGKRGYRLGDPMHVFDDGRLLGIVDPVLVSEDLSEVHVEHFTPTDFVRSADFHIGRLVFLEICAFLCGNFQSVGSITFVLSRKVDVLGTGMHQALSRAETITRMGATDIKIGPKPDRMPGQFAISGVWLYSDRTLSALMTILDEERRSYAEWKRKSRDPWLHRVRDLLSQLALRRRGQ